MGQAQDDYTQARERLLAEIDREVLDTARWLGAGKLDAAVRAAMAAVPRHEFVPSIEQSLAYLNRPLSIGHGQTISQPYIVAAMTHLLHPHGGMRVLEVGTGCGYQTAVLAEIVAGVWSVERIAALADAAAERLARLGYASVRVKTADGSLGWPEHAPYDGILVTAAAREVPPALIDQLAPGGRLVIPVGAGRFEQALTIVEKDSAGAVTVTPGLAVAFVPLVGGG